MRKTPLLLVALLATASCKTVPGPPSAGASFDFASMYVFRGVPQVDATVFQPTVDVTFPVDESSSASITGLSSFGSIGSSGSMACLLLTTSLGRARNCRF